MNSRVRVLIVDDSAFARFSISKQLDLDPEIEVVGVARDGIEALDKIEKLKPSVVTMDVQMPRMDGLTTLKHIMSEYPTPVVMVSSLTSEGAETTIEALELGAVDFFLKSSPASPVGYPELASDLVNKVKLAAGVKVPKLLAIARTKTAPPQREKKPQWRHHSPPSKVLVIGSSTGGPSALYKLIPNLSGDISASILVVQHMPPGFTTSLANRLDQLSQIEVREARSGEPLGRGQGLVAPGDYHMMVTRGGKIHLNQGPPVHGVRPAVDVTMESVAQVYSGSAIGVVLTGMGSDGTRGAALIREAGGKIAVEDESTCVVYGMPRSVIESGNADEVVPLSQMAEKIARMCQEHTGPGTRG